VDDLNKRIKSLDAWLDERAKCDERVLRLQTHPGIGLLTSLALVHALEPVSRFGGGRKVAAYVGLDPMEYSSGEKQRCSGLGRTAGYSHATWEAMRRAVESLDYDPAEIVVFDAGPGKIGYGSAGRGDREGGLRC
jgi:transposase